MTKLSNRTLIIVLVIVFALAGGIKVLITNQKEKQMAEMEQVITDFENAISQRNYTYALELLEENDIEVFSEYSQYSGKYFEELKRSLPTAIELEKLFHEDKEKYIEKLKVVKPTLEGSLFQQTKEQFSTIIDSNITAQNGVEIKRLSDAGYLNHEFLPSRTVEKVEEFLLEIELVGLLNNNQLEELAIKTVNYEDGTVLKNIYHLAHAIKAEQQDKSMVTAYLVNIPIGFSHFPQPFQEKYDALMDKYEDTEKFKISLMVKESNERQKRKNNITKTIQLGMTTSEVQSLLGNPTDINKTVNTYGTSEQWVYKDYNGYKFVYFENGIVTSISE